MFVCEWPTFEDLIQGVTKKCMCGSIERPVISSVDHVCMLWLCYDIFVILLH